MTGSRPPTGANYLRPPGAAQNDTLSIGDVIRIHKDGLRRLFKSYCNKVGVKRSGNNTIGMNGTFDKYSENSNTLDKTTFMQLCNDFSLYMKKTRKVNSTGEKIKRTAAAWYMLWITSSHEEEFPEYRISNAKEIFKTNRSENWFRKGSWQRPAPESHLGESHRLRRKSRFRSRTISSPYKDSPLKARILTNRQVQNYSKYRTISTPIAWRWGLCFRTFMMRAGRIPPL